MKIRIATRKSPLALAQTRWVAKELTRHRPDLEVEEVHIVTQGDRIQDRPLSEVGGKGLFVTEIEEALADGRADLAVHSMKDVPAVLADGLSIVCVPVREDARDALLTKDGVELDGLEAFSRIGTSSLRRRAQICRRRNDVICEPVRGNVDTRIRKLEEGQFRAIVLAVAGLRRLGLTHHAHRLLSVEECIPAVGQGALGLEARSDDAHVAALVKHLDHADTRLAVEAERAFLAMLDGGCQLPIAAHAQLSHNGTRLRFDALVGSADGAQMVQGGSDRPLSGRDFEERIAAARLVGREVAERMIADGAKELVDGARALAGTQGWKK